MEVECNVLCPGQLSDNRANRTLQILKDKPENQGKKVVAVIITISNKGSYDTLFQEVEQKAIGGTVVEVYACDSLYLQNLILAFEGHPQDQVAERMIRSVERVDTDCTVVNWECCGGYANKQFPETPERLFYFLKEIVDRGHMAMFSDFSLKALINNWDQKYGLGPNPFVKDPNEASQMVTLHFIPRHLKECPSAQLQILGDLVDSGEITIGALGGTIIYHVDRTKLNHNRYKLEDLTVVPQFRSGQKEWVSSVGESEGAAGHVLLSYPSGGMILTSMGHWIQLMKVNSKADKLFQVAEKEYGFEMAEAMRKEYSVLDEAQQQQYTCELSKKFVQSQAPCSNMSRKQRKNG